MSKFGVIRCILSLLMVAYLIVALPMTARMAKSENLKSFKINVDDPTGVGFVTSDDVDRHLGSLSRRIGSYTFSDFNSLSVEKDVLKMDQLEAANCVVYGNGAVALNVTPLVPVMRVFDVDGTNYYVNRAGKRMTASPQFRIDVPVVTGDFARFNPTDVLPVIDFINADPRLSSFISAISVDRRGDIMLTPKIKGHVVNFGDTCDIKNKFDRLLIFYRKVLPVKGWEHYDTVSVKWRRQVVAHQANFEKRPTPVAYEDIDEIPDEETMRVP